MKLFVAFYLFFALSLRAQDNPRLINITTLDQLYAIRYDMNGDGTPDTDIQSAEKTAYRTAFGLTGIANNTCVGGCQGYELMNDLDFNDADGNGPGSTPSKWSKNCTSDCEVGTKTDGTIGNTGWEPIYYYHFDDRGTPDTSDDLEIYNSFGSRFHGNELTISNLYIDRQSSSIYAGLFGRTEDVTLDSLGLENIEVKIESTGNNALAGGLVGSITTNGNSSITACYVTGDVTSSSSSDSYAGGLVGWISSGVSSITACYATGDVSASSSAGGLVGRITTTGSSSITECYATGDVSSSSSNSYAGGLVGSIKNYSGSSSSIVACYATGDVSSSFYAGGFVGYIDNVHSSSIIACYATGGVSASSSAGGLVGFIHSSGSSSSIIACYAAGDASSSSSSSDSYAGGLVGYVSSDGTNSITACYATGDVTSSSSSSDSYAGGLLGFVHSSSSSSSSIIACYAVGDVTLSSYAGGLVGDVSSGVSITASYYANEAIIAGISVNTLGSTCPFVALIAAIAYGFDHDSDNATDVLYPAMNWNIDVDNADRDDDTTSGSDDPWDFGGATDWPVLEDIDSNGDGTIDAADLMEQRRVLPIPPPTNVGTETITSNSAALSWDAYIGAASFKVHFATTSDFVPDASNEFVSMLDGTATIVVVNGLTAGTIYYFRVAAVNSADKDTYAGQVSATIRPAAPASLVAMVVSDAEVALTWQPPTNPGDVAITGYQLQVSEDGGTTFTDLYRATSTILSYEHRGLPAGSARHYRVAAINSGGTGSYTDPPVSATTYDVPSVPVDLVAMALSRDRIDVEWEAPDSDGGTPITDYQLWYSEDKDGPWIDLGTTSDGSYSHIGLDRGTAYYYRVAAINEVDVGSYTDPPVSATTYDVPSVPMGLAAVTVSRDRIDVEWEAPDSDGGTPITGYQLQVSEDGGTTFSNLYRTNGTILSYEHRGLSAGSTRHYRVAAINSGGRGSYSDPASATTLPAAPTGLVAMVVSDAGVALTWQPPTNPGGAAITSYQLWYSEDKDGPWIDLGTTSDGSILSYSHIGLDRGTAYYYRVAAINSGGRGSYTDPPVSATTYDVPSVPMGLAAVTVSRDRIDVEWEAPDSDGGTPITGYQLQVSEDGGTTFSNLYRTAGTMLSYEHGGLPAGSTRHYRVAAINIEGRGLYSDPASATTLPAAPTGLVAMVVSDAEVALTWQPPTNPGGAAITGYQLQVSEDGGTIFSNLYRTNGTMLSYEHGGLPAGSTRHYRVAAINGGGRGSYSSSVSVTTSVTMLSAAPTGLVATAVSDAEVALT